MDNSLSLPGYGEDAAISDNYCFVVDGNLQVVDINDLKDTTIVNSLSTPGSSPGISIKDNYAYIVDANHDKQGPGNFSVVDISDLHILELLTTNSTQNAANAIERQNNKAYVAESNLNREGFPGIEIFDLSDPARPKQLKSIEVLAKCWDIEVKGSYAYLATENGLYVVAIDDLNNPEIVHLQDIPRCYGLDISEDHVYVTAAENHTFYAVDIRDPMHPEVESKISIQDSASNAEIHSNIACLASDGGMWIIDSSDPNNLKELEFVTTESNFNTVIDKEHAFIFGFNFYVFDLSVYIQPTKPRDPGDINGDGQITLRDAVLGLQINIGVIDLQGKGYTNADVDGDGKINMKEVSYILEHIVQNK